MPDLVSANHFLDNLNDLLGMYTYRHKERHILLNSNMEYLIMQMAVSYTHLFNLFLDFGDLSFVIESLTALRRKPFYHRKRVFQIDDKLDLVMNGTEDLTCLFFVLTMKIGMPVATERY